MRALSGVLADLDLADTGLHIVGESRPAVLSSPLAVADCAVAAVAACLIAAADLSDARSGRRPTVTLDTAHVAAEVCSEV